jgi:transcriptional regulator with GAF, ATPase, and Fis domain
MQQRRARKLSVKDQRAKKPKTRKLSVSISSSDDRQKGLIKRLRRERDQALQLQAASAEVLRAIGSSRGGELTSVFEAMLANALRICEAKFGHILLYDGERFHAAYLHDVPASYRAFWEQHGPIRPKPNTGLGLLVRTKQIAHIPDLKAHSAYAEREPLRIVTVDQAGARSFLSVPMLKENELIGAIVIYRQEVQPFTERQIDLVKIFANQGGRRRRPTSLRSSAARPSTCSRCWIRWSKRPHGCARPRAPLFRSARARFIAMWRRSLTRRSISPS